ncbi:MAG: MoaD/ThiS family protein [Planctomycetes bacterium]|nr:MoaD/ThiS family protein [Planctomycetota bacterium]
MAHQVLLFAGLRELFGQESLEVPDTITNVGELRIFLVGQWPQLQSQSFAITVNHEWSSAQTALVADDEIALLPPVSGG